MELLVMDIYLFVKVIHILSSTILFGTGMGIAFFMFSSYFTKKVHEKLYAARMTVIADYLFTLPAVFIQPATGIWLVWYGGFNWLDFWLVATYLIFVVAGICWIPVVWIQIQLKTMLVSSVANGTDLPERYFRLFRWWFLLGWPAFIGLVYVFFLMVMKPA